jgi:PAS domain S-box-containing protein
MIEPSAEVGDGPEAVALLVAFLENAPLAAVVLDRELRLLLVNGRAAACAALRGAERGRRLAELLPDAALALEPALERARDGGAPVRDVELELPARDGAGPRAFLVDCFPVRGRGGAVAAVAAVAREVTRERNLESALRERVGELEALLDAVKHAEARLADEARRHADLFSLANDAVLVWRLDGGIESWNRGAEELYGFSAAEAREQSPQSLLKTAAPVPWAQVEGALRGPGQWTGELVHRTRDGRRLTVLAKLQRFHGADGAERVLEVVRDVTDQRRAQAELASLARFPEESPDPVFRVGADLKVSYANPAAVARLGGLGLVRGALAPAAVARLAERVAGAGGRLRGEVEAGDRVYELSLVAAGGEVNVYGRDVTDHRRVEELLRREGQRRAEFLAILSHELRNPLTPIQNSLALLRGAPPGSAVAAHSREVLDRQVGHLERLVDDLLDLTRISHGKIALRRQVVDAVEVVGRACEDLRPTAEARRLDLRVVLPAAPAWIDADPTRVAQVVGNLVNNAMKFTPAGGAVAVAVAAEGGACRIAVRDDGEGIAAEDLERIFEPFAQADRTRGASPGGVGLGLALVKSLVVLHGGTVRAASDGIGRGAEVAVSLPLAPPPAGAAAGRAEEVAPARPLSIVVVDDNVDAGETLAALLALEGHDARVACDGRAGIAACEAAPPDVLVCDIGLPDVDGYEVVRAVRRRCGDRVYAVALTGFAQGEDVARAREAGFDAHVAKPPSFDALRSLLARVPRRAGPL